MRKLTSISLVFFLVGYMVQFGFAEECRKAEKLVSFTMANPPDDMTEEYVKMAIQMCPERSGLIKRVAEYYKHWYKTEINPVKQAELKILAQDYYRKAIENGVNSKAMKTELTKLKNSREFNEVAFRALRPSSAGQTRSGLDMKVHFKRNSHVLDDTAQDNLDVLGRLLLEDRSLRISVEGHTDMTGTKDYNQVLSLKRAESAKKYLTWKFGIKSDRIHTKGHGFNLADPDHPQSETNRRVEVIKLKQNK
ncbi:MAG: OmpA family protein [bacterium]|nr:OmpA family protein [bacterium]